MPTSSKVGDNAGAVYLVSGPLESGTDLSAAVATVEGEPGNELGRNIAAAGDVDHDGHDDFLVGLDHVGVWLFNGPLDGTHSLDQAQASFTVDGMQLETLNGAGTVVGLGDLDGDEHSDFAIGARLVDSVVNSESVEEAGQVYLFEGRSW